VDDHLDAMRRLRHIGSVHGIAGVPFDWRRKPRPGSVADQAAHLPAAAQQCRRNLPAGTAGGAQYQSLACSAHCVPLKVTRHECRGHEG